MNELFEMAGMQLPEFLGKKMDPTSTEDGEIVSANEASDIASSAKEVKEVKEVPEVKVPAVEVKPAEEKKPVEKAQAPAAPAKASTDDQKRAPIWETNPQAPTEEL